MEGKLPVKYNRTRGHGDSRRSVRDRGRGRRANGGKVRFLRNSALFSEEAGSGQPL